MSHPDDIKFFQGKLDAAEYLASHDPETTALSNDVVMGAIYGVTEYVRYAVEAEPVNTSSLSGAAINSIARLSSHRNIQPPLSPEQQSKIASLIAACMRQTVPISETYNELPYAVVATGCLLSPLPAAVKVA